MIAFSKRLSAWLRSRKAQMAPGRAGSPSRPSERFAIATALHLRLPLWAVLTSLIVTQMSVGRSLKATRDYMFGTVGGAIYGGAIAVLIPHSGEGALLALLVLAVAPLAFIAAINPSLNAATVTAVIVLLVPTMSHVNPLDSAIDRVLEVTVGALTGLAGVFPRAAVAGAQPDSRQRGADARIDRSGVVRIAGWPDPRPGQRCLAPDSGWHRQGAGRVECDWAQRRSASARRICPAGRTPVRCCGPYCGCATIS